MEKEQVKTLYDYTKFHIGLYSTLITGLIALISFGFGEARDLYLSWIKAIIIVLLIAGVFGAIVASRIVYGKWSEDTLATESSRFWKIRRLGNIKWRIADIFTTVEHYAFWIAIVIAIFGFYFTSEISSPDKEAVTRSLKQPDCVATSILWVKGADCQQASKGVVTVKTVRFIKPDLAIVDGESTIPVPSGNDVKLKSGTFTTLLMKNDNQWSVKFWKADY
ncbi:MAG TPA: hypothetical protein VF538_04320 [Pyrinomonadaceae bacterium]|jgi:MFS family permease